MKKEGDEIELSWKYWEVEGLGEETSVLKPEN